MVSSEISVGEGVVVGAGVIEVEFVLAIGVGTIVTVSDGLVDGLDVELLLLITTGVGDEVKVGLDVLEETLLTSGVGDIVAVGLSVLEMLVLLTGVGDDVMVGGELVVELLLTIGVGCIVSVGELEGVAVGLIDESDSSAMVAATKLESEAELAGCIVSVGEGVAVGLAVLELLLAAGVGSMVTVGIGLGLFDPSSPISSSIPSSTIFCFFLFVSSMSSSISSSITSFSMSLLLMTP